ncbi:S-methyl-5-thioribose-1-phosphate isomerase [Mariprofundus erugo]|uniref:Methylthioribose-1-phosphate isomerase n=1 Tax=Mariprofundus erugo TaxID=2528639 RepID=A0A5R9GV21_9PROT|nr:S-methyl-5-thioribose-1-phosphate isomerase [Mariprofundus erugo]TLS68775.1 S-methyl-5-thioribose-1-phosphate isomerase [Mariprofundus erugo]
MRIGQDEYRAVFWDTSTQAVRWIEQRLLPHTFTIVGSRNPEDVAQAIETMQVRGAPSIGAVAALGLALAWQVDRGRFFDYWLQRFRRTRPTAVNLFHACDVMEGLAIGEPSSEVMIERAVYYGDEEVAANCRMGEHLAELLAVGERRILTHCNAGWLAAVDWGTATSGIYHLARAGESPFVWVDETRPRLQGARLTAWELMEEGIACALQADSAAAWMMAQGKVDCVVVGADRVAANGDVANKVGTYALSLAAKAHGIPMYIAAPSSTFDRMCSKGADIPIEDRHGDEVTVMDGMDQKRCHRHIRVATERVRVNNPAFDVTPYENISAIISENGLWARGAD